MQKTQANRGSPGADACNRTRTVKGGRSDRKRHGKTREQDPTTLATVLLEDRVPLARLDLVLDRFGSRRRDTLFAETTRYLCSYLSCIHPREADGWERTKTETEREVALLLMIDKLPSVASPAPHFILAYIKCQQTAP